MAAWRRAIELSLGEADTAKLRSTAQSRTEPASRVERARILLAYREDPSFFAVGRALGLHHQTVQRCVERAVAEGPLAALDDRPRPGREPTITLEAKAWLVSLPCRKAKELGYPHELWTTRLLARHAREHGPAEGHACLANLAQGTVCKILDQEEVKPHKVRYYLEQRGHVAEASSQQHAAPSICEESGDACQPSGYTASFSSFLSSEPKCNTPADLIIGTVDQDLRECCHVTLFAFVG